MRSRVRAIFATSAPRVQQSATPEAGVASQLRRPRIFLTRGVKPRAHRTATASVALTAVTRPSTPTVARGARPALGCGGGLAGLAVVYFGALLHHPPGWAWLRPAGFFTEATSLFPLSNSVVLEYRIEVWACGHDWQPIDHRAYFRSSPTTRSRGFSGSATSTSTRRPSRSATATSARRSTATSSAATRRRRRRRDRADRRDPRGQDREAVPGARRARRALSLRRDRAGAGRPAPRQVRDAGGGQEAAMREFLTLVERHLLAPRPIARLVVVRIFASLAILGFLSSRIVHADDWLSVAGFRLPDVDRLAHAARAAGATGVGGVDGRRGAHRHRARHRRRRVHAVVERPVRGAAGLRRARRPARGVHRVQARAVVALALCLSPSGARASVDAWRLRRREPGRGAAGPGLGRLRRVFPVPAAGVLPRLGAGQGARRLAQRQLRPLDPPPRFVPDHRELACRQLPADAAVDGDPARRAGVRVLLAAVVRAALDPAVCADLRARHAPHDRPHVRAGDLVLPVDDDAARRELRAGALAGPRAAPCTRPAGSLASSRTPSRG